MEQSVVAGSPHKFVFRMFGVSLSAHGMVAFALSIPVSLILVAVAYRIFAH
jgi:hypothetical protein